MKRSRVSAAVRLGAVVLAVSGTAAQAEEVTGKVVWVDQRHSSLLLECPDKGCAAIPNAKPGETYTFVVPAAMKKKAVALKEGQTVTLVYDDGKDKGYVITSVRK